MIKLKSPLMILVLGKSEGRESQKWGCRCCCAGPYMLRMMNGDELGGWTETSMMRLQVDVAMC